MKNFRPFILVLCITAASGCTAVTDFSDIEGGYSLGDKLVTPIVVGLSGQTGSVSLKFDTPLPEAEDADLLALLEDQIVSVEVQHVATGTTYSLTQGLRVSDEPNDSGEYRLSLSEDRKTVSVTFFNSFNGASVQVGESYTAIIEVAANDFFKVDALTISDVQVVAQ